MTVVAERAPKIRMAGKGQRILVAHARAATELGDGMVEAVTSAFGVEFTEGGMFKSRQVVIEKGAFSESLQAKPTAPLMWQHAWQYGPIGQTVEEEETDQGLRIVGELYIEEELPRRVYRSMKPKEEGGQGALTEWSIGFYLEEYDLEERTEDEDGNELEDLYHYTKIDRAEHSVVLRGANPATETISVNSAGVAVAAPHSPLDTPCTMPAEFVVAGRRYVAKDPVVLPHAAASRLPDEITFAGTRYVHTPAWTEVTFTDEVDSDSKPWGMVPGAERLLARPTVRAAAFDQKDPAASGGNTQGREKP